MEYISEEIAKLAKKKGYDVPCNSAYKKIGMPFWTFCEDCTLMENDADDVINQIRKKKFHQVLYNKTNFNAFGDDVMSAPYEDELEDWLRNKHNIFLSIVPTTTRLKATVFKNGVEIHKDTRNIDSYGELMQSILIVALNEIKDVKPIKIKKKK